MPNEEDRCQKLCRLAKKETDLRKLLKLVQQIKALVKPQVHRKRLR